MLSARIIPCLDVDAGRVVKGVRFKELRDAFSHFDDNDNVVGYVKNGPLLKPIIEKINSTKASKLNIPLFNCIPIVSIVSYFNLSSI